tara:strand:+ start:953 stop:1681 length:729 start_codon:yes stop_codon:yes gene_type:complete
MSLPKIDIPTFTTKLLSTGQKITYRPFLVKEEKILYMALESNDASEMTRAMKQIINNCVQTEIDIEELPLFDIEYLMIHLRARSVGESAEVIHRCQQPLDNEVCGNEINLNISLENISLNKPSPKEPPSVSITDQIGIQMRYPKTEILSATLADDEDALQNIWNAVELCIDFIYDEESVYHLDNYTEDEKLDFFESLTQEQFGQLREFFEDLPRLQYTESYKCKKCNYDGPLVIEGVDSFFV